MQNNETFLLALSKSQFAFGFVLKLIWLKTTCDHFACQLNELRWYTQNKPFCISQADNMTNQRILTPRMYSICHTCARVTCHYPWLITMRQSTGFVPSSDDESPLTYTCMGWPVNTFRHSSHSNPKQEMIIIYDCPYTRLLLRNEIGIPNLIVLMQKTRPTDQSI